MKQNDTEEVFGLGKKLFREKDEIPFFKKALKQYVPELSFVAVDNTTVVGFVLVCEQITSDYCDFLNKIPNCFEISFLGISSSCQGQGLGTRLLKETLVAIFQKSRNFTCWLLVDTINTSAIRLYERLGFRIWADADEVDTSVPSYVMGLSHRRYSDATESDDECKEASDKYGMIPLVSV